MNECIVFFVFFCFLDQAIINGVFAEFLKANVYFFPELLYKWKTSKILGRH